MSTMRQERISSSAEVFAEMMREYENILGGTLTTMDEKDGTEAEVVLKLKIIVEEVPIEDGDKYRYAKAPRFEYKCSSNMKLQRKASRMIANCNGELVWDRETGWMLRELAENSLLFLMTDRRHRR